MYLIHFTFIWLLQVHNLQAFKSEVTSLTQAVPFEQYNYLGLHIGEWPMACQAFGALLLPPLRRVSRTISTLRILQSFSTLYQISQAYFWHSSVLWMPWDNALRNDSVSYTYQIWFLPLGACYSTPLWRGCKYSYLMVSCCFAYFVVCVSM